MKRLINFLFSNSFKNSFVHPKQQNKKRLKDFSLILKKLAKDFKLSTRQSTNKKRFNYLEIGTYCGESAIFLTKL